MDSNGFKSTQSQMEKDNDKFAIEETNPLDSIQDSEEALESVIAGLNRSGISSREIMYTKTDVSPVKDTIKPVPVEVISSTTVTEDSEPTEKKPPSAFPVEKPDGFGARTWSRTKNCLKGFGVVEYTMLFGGLYLGARCFHREGLPVLKRVLGLSTDPGKRIRGVVIQPMSPANAIHWQVFDVPPTILSTSKALLKSAQSNPSHKFRLSLFGIHLTPYGDIIARRALTGAADKVTRIRVVSSTPPTIESPLRTVEGVPLVSRLCSAWMSPLASVSLCHYLLRIGQATVHPDLKADNEITQLTEPNNDLSIPSDRNRMMSSLYIAQTYAQRRLNGVWKSRPFLDLDRPIVRFLFVLYRPLYSKLIFPLYSPKDTLPKRDSTGSGEGSSSAGELNGVVAAESQGTNVIT